MKTIRLLNHKVFVNSTIFLEPNALELEFLENTRKLWWSFLHGKHEKAFYHNHGAIIHAVGLNYDLQPAKLIGGSYPRKIVWLHWLSVQSIYREWGFNEHKKLTPSDLTEAVEELTGMPARDFAMNNPHERLPMHMEDLRMALHWHLIRKAASDCKAHFLQNARPKGPLVKKTADVLERLLWLLTPEQAVMISPHCLTSEVSERILYLNKGIHESSLERLLDPIVGFIAIRSVEKL